MQSRHLIATTVLCVLASTTSSRVGAEEPASKPTATEIQTLLDSTDEIATTVSKLRGLPVKRKIARGALSREEITKRLLAKVDEQYQPHELAVEERTLKRLGLLPVDADYKTLVMDILTEQVAGFYDPDARELYIADWIDAEDQRMVMAHEIDHALQDQSFDLDKFVVPIKDNADSQLARQALVEGDGMAVTVEFMLRERKMNYDPWGDDTIAKMMAGSASVMAQGMEKLAKAPLFLREQIMFPYAQGLMFVAASRKTQPWSAIDAMFKNPPASTEQIIHPEKYAAGEKPVAVRSAPLPSLKKWKQIYVNTLGELLFSITFRQHGVAEEPAKTAAAGWGGDRLVVLAPPGDDGKSPGKVLVISMSTWDAEMDALEAFDAAKEVVASLSGAQVVAAPAEAGAFASFADASGLVSFAERKGSNLVIVVGAPADLAPKVRTDIWARWRAK